MLARLKSKILHAVGYRKKIDMRVCTINKVDDLIPDSIGEATVLIIENPCSVTAAYYLIDGRPNITNIIVSGTNYTRQEIMNLPIDAKLGSWSGVRVTFQTVPVAGEVVEAAPTVNTAFTTWVEYPIDQAVNNREVAGAWDQIAGVWDQINPIGDIYTGGLE